MDWNLFWSAFGAIGTTIGSLTTAIAVIVAVKQYLQPLSKRIKVECNIAIPLTLDEYLITIKAINYGTRPVIINDFLFKTPQKSLLLTYAQIDIVTSIIFPKYLAPEETCEIFLYYDKIQHHISDLVKQGELSKHSKITVCASDTTGKKYFANKKISVRKFCGEMLGKKVHPICKN